MTAGAEALLCAEGLAVDGASALLVALAVPPLAFDKPLLSPVEQEASAAPNHTLETLPRQGWRPSARQKPNCADEFIGDVDMPTYPVSITQPRPFLSCESSMAQAGPNIPIAAPPSNPGNP